jgi:hypothetical protein
MVNSPTFVDAHGAQKADSTATSLPGRLGRGWGVSEALEGFVTSLPRISGTRETTASHEVTPRQDRVPPAAPEAVEPALISDKLPASVSPILYSRATKQPGG